ncbi:MAG: hypothetical protein JWM02_2455 [Frankiales bacterium]|nr:hypothetical protein [Frankiales bacterium]
MKDALKGYLALASGLSEVTRQRATAAAKALVAQGEATAGQVTSLADDLIAQSKGNREALAALVKFEVDRTLGRVGLASADEVTELTARVRALEAQLREATKPAVASSQRAAVATAPAKSATARKAPAKKASAKRAPAKVAAKKVPAKKAGV